MNEFNESEPSNGTAGENQRLLDVPVVGESKASFLSPRPHSFATPPPFQPLQYAQMASGESPCISTHKSAFFAFLQFFFPLKEKFPFFL